jgi:hypothetical protein
VSRNWREKKGAWRCELGYPKIENFVLRKTLALLCEQNAPEKLKIARNSFFLKQKYGLISNIFCFYF